MEQQDLYSPSPPIILSLLRWVVRARGSLYLLLKSQACFVWNLEPISCLQSQPRLFFSKLQFTGTSCFGKETLLWFCFKKGLENSKCPQILKCLLPTCSTSIAPEKSLLPSCSVRNSHGKRQSNLFSSVLCCSPGWGCVIREQRGGAILSFYHVRSGTEPEHQM